MKYPLQGIFLLENEEPVLVFTKIFSLDLAIFDSNGFSYFYKMKKIYYLQTCDTCRRILKEFDFQGFEKQEIKTEPITAVQLDEMKILAGSYEALFSRKAKKYKEMGLKDEILTEKDYRHYILNDYTFLKRPVIIDGDQVFIGNEKKNLEKLMLHLTSKEN